MKENQEYPLYEDEIDLRALLETLWRGRKFIFVFTLLTTLLALGISLLLPRQYTASVFILVNSPWQYTASVFILANSPLIDLY